MWLAFYNESVGDVIMLTKGTTEGKISVDTKENITIIYDALTEEPIAINIFNVKDDLNLTESGLQKLSDIQKDWINNKLKDAGYKFEIDINSEEMFVVGYVEECEPHQDSDHLSVTQTRISDNEVLQIVCGAQNINKGLTVLVARPGAVMPSGTIIWPGKLRGVTSNGMICSTRELDLTDIENLPGIWELEDKFRPGTLLSQVVTTLNA